jgi:two-component system, LuxR family, sensor kinase FixL
MVNRMTDILSIYAPANRVKLLSVAGFLVLAIAILDWRTKPYLSLGFLYLFPIVIAGGFLSRTQIVVVALICAFLQEAFSNLPQNEAVIRLIFSSAGFIGIGLLIAQLVRNRRVVLQHVAELENEMSLRHDAEEQLQILVESSPAAIVTIDATGTILLANQAAQQLLAPDDSSLRGGKIASYLPALQTAVESRPSRSFRTNLQCRGQRSSGEAFLAGVWFSTYNTISGPRLAAVIVDLSEDLRDREDLSLDYLLKNSRILVGAMAHEVRNLSAAALVVHKNLSRVAELRHNADFQALNTLIQSLERMSTLSMRSSPADAPAAVDLTSVLDELRVLIEEAYRESAIEIDWQLVYPLPLVLADRYGLIQVFLNLAKNSRRAMESSDLKRLHVGTSVDGNNIVVRFADTGIGIASADDLFRPFQPGATSTGLGLYISRAIMRSFGGELLHEPGTQGCCFAVILPMAPAVQGGANG